MNSLETQGCLGWGLIGSGTKSFMFITYCPSSLFLIFRKLFCSGANLCLLFWQWSVWSWTLFSCRELLMCSECTRFSLSDASLSDRSKLSLRLLGFLKSSSNQKIASTFLVLLCSFKALITVGVSCCFRLLTIHSLAHLWLRLQPLYVSVKARPWSPEAKSPDTVFSWTWVSPKAGSVTTHSVTYD